MSNVHILNAVFIDFVMVMDRNLILMHYMNKNQILKNICSNLSTPINAIYWFEGRGIKSQNAYGVIQRVITAFASPINNFNMFSDNIIRLLDDEFEFSQNRKNRFRINCNKFRKTLYDYYKSNMKDTHPTVKFFKSARWFNIDSIVSPPDSCKDAHVGIPWGWGFLSYN
eukprot:145499_1